MITNPQSDNRVDLLEHGLVSCGPTRTYHHVMRGFYYYSNRQILVRGDASVAASSAAATRLEMQATLTPGGGLRLSLTLPCTSTGSVVQ